jgi:hypothetical protein
MGVPQCGGGEHKKCTVGHGGAGGGRILVRSKSILLLFARAGSLKVYLFFY